MKSEKAHMIDINTNNFKISNTCKTNDFRIGIINTSIKMIIVSASLLVLNQKMCFLK